MAGTSIEYWDSCMFLAYIKGETSHAAGTFDYLKDRVRKFDSGILTLATSTICIPEVVGASLTDELRKRFSAMLNRSNMHSVDATPAVCRLAADIREYFRQNPLTAGNGRPIYPSTADAIHVASAISVNRTANASVDLITLDHRNKPPKEEMAMVAMNAYISSKYRTRVMLPPLAGITPTLPGMD
jgi:hypothetical protein